MGCLKSFRVEPITFLFGYLFGIRILYFQLKRAGQKASSNFSFILISFFYAYIANTCKRNYLPTDKIMKYTLYTDSPVIGDTFVKYRS